MVKKSEVSTNQARRCLGVLVASALLVSTGCSGADTSAAETSISSTTATTTPATTVAAPTTASTTDTSDSATSDEDQILELHEFYMTEFTKVNRLEEDIEIDIATAQTFMTDPLLTRWTESVRDSALVGDYVIGPGYTSNVTEVTINGNEATVTDCSLGVAVGYLKNGEVHTPGDDFYKFRYLEYLKVEDQWRLADRAVGEQCDPEQY